MGWVDKYGRATANGRRRIYTGSIAHDGRPLPFDLQVRPQKAVPTFRSTGTHKPWAHYFGKTYKLLLHGDPVPFLWAVDADSHHHVHLAGVLVYKVDKDLGTCDAFGVVEALCLYYDKDYILWI